MKSVYKLLIEWGDSDPDFKFIHYKKSYSISNLINEVEAISKSLKYIPDAKIGILVKSKLDFILLYLACVNLDKIPVVLKNTWGENELNNIIESNDINHIICEWGNKSINNKNSTVYFFEELVNSSRGCGVPIDSKNKNLFESIVFTSGSTGPPKGVCLERKNFHASAMAWGKEIQFTSDDKYGICLPLDHIAGLSILYRSIYFRFSLNLLDHYTDTNKTDSSIVSFIPTILNRIIDDNKYHKFLKSCKSIILGGESASIELLKQCLDLKLNVFISYGMTETCSGVSGFWINEYPDKLKSAGKAFDGVQLSLSNNHVSIKSDMNMRGYYLEDQLDNSFISSDTGRIIEDFLYIDDIRNDIGISGGEKINIKKNL